MLEYLLIAPKLKYQIHTAELWVITSTAGFSMCTYLSVPASELACHKLWVNFCSLFYELGIIVGVFDLVSLLITSDWNSQQTVGMVRKL